MLTVRSILGICLQDRISNTEVLDCANSSSIDSMLLKTQLIWVGHVICMEQHRIPWRLLCGELAACKRHQGHPETLLRPICFGGPGFIELPPPFKLPECSTTTASQCLHCSRLGLRSHLWVISMQGHLRIEGQPPSRITTNHRLVGKTTTIIFIS